MLKMRDEHDILSDYVDRITVYRRQVYVVIYCMICMLENVASRETLCPSVTKR